MSNKSERANTSLLEDPVKQRLDAVLIKIGVTDWVISADDDAAGMWHGALNAFPYQISLAIRRRSLMKFIEESSIH